MRSSLAFVGLLALMGPSLSANAGSPGETRQSARAEARREAALGALRPGMPYRVVRRLLQRDGWRPYWNPGRSEIARCQVHRRICLTYTETEGCWRDGETIRCAFEFVGTGRTKPRHEDDAVSIGIRVERAGELIYERHRVQPFGGPG